MTLSLLLICICALASCAPVRPEAGDGNGGGNSYRGAIFQERALGYFATYSYAQLHLVDDIDFGCDDLRYGNQFYWWDLAEGVHFVSTYFYRGDNIESQSWEMTFRSQFDWEQDANFDYSIADFFNGNHGIGGQGLGDDDVPAPGRDIEGNLGLDMDHREDTLQITSFGEDMVRGRIQSEEGNWSFNAVNCGIFSDYYYYDGIGAAEVPQRDTDASFGQRLRRWWSDR